MWAHDVWPDDVWPGDVWAPQVLVGVSNNVWVSWITGV